VCRSFFPNLVQRLKTKIPITSEFTALVTGHGKTRSYLHRFKLADDLMCLCNEGQQTSDHIIFDCNLFEAQRSPMIKKIVDSGGSWPPAKDELTTKYLQAFSTFVKSIDFQKSRLVVPITDQKNKQWIICTLEHVVLPRNANMLYINIYLKKPLPPDSSLMPPTSTLLTDTVLLRTYHRPHSSLNRVFSLKVDR